MQANRESLLKVASLVRPALSNQSYIPALSHIRFAAGFATAYNDVLAIGVKYDTEIDACVPGELFIKALGSFNTENVVLQDLDGTALLVTAGRSKLKLPVLPAKDFPFKEPTGRPDVVELTDDILAAIKRCLISVGSDPTRPEQMGVTLQVEDGKAVTYSTDNFTISRCTTKSKISLPGDAPIILPLEFCEQLLSMSNVYPDEEADLLVYPGGLFAKFGKKAWVMTKTVVDLEPLDFEAALGKAANLKRLGDEMQKMPTTMDSAWNRAMLVLSGVADPATKVTVNKESVDLLSRSDTGEAEDTLMLEGLEEMDFYVDPSLVVRGLKHAACIAFYKRALVLASADGAFVHVIAHCAG